MIPILKDNSNLLNNIYFNINPIDKKKIDNSNVYE